MLFPVTILLPLHLALQEPAERVFLDSLLADLHHGTAAAALPPKERCTTWSTDLNRLCEGLVAERRAEFSGNADDALAADALMLRTVMEKPKWATGWYGLGITRLQLARLKVLSHEGPLLPMGVSNEAGAANALVHALELDPELSIAAEALANAPEPREGSSALKERVAMLRRVRAALSPAALAATANLERDGGSVDSAIALERRALASGQVDSGLVLLPLARDLYRIGDPNAGRNALIMGAGIGTDATDKAYRTELAWVASPKELKEWDSLLAADRANWVANFWSKRDIAEGRKDGERLIEHYRRIEYAMANFRVTMPQTGRQQYLSFTPQSQLETWIRKCAEANPDSFPDLARFDEESEMIGSDSPHRYYQPIQDQLDDRGVVYVRHGKPTKDAISISGEAIEVWRYERSEGPLVLQFREADFQGSVSATVLVPTLLTISPPSTRNDVCSLEISLCSPTADATPPASMGLTQSRLPGCTSRQVEIMTKGRDQVIRADGAIDSPEAIVHARDKGREMIDLATTTDTWHRTFSHAVTPSVQIYGLDRATGGAPRLVVAFAVPGDQLAHPTSDAAAGRTIYPLRIQVMAARTPDARRIDLDTTRYFATAAPLTKGQFLTGLVERPVPAGAYTTSVVFTQDDGRGAVAHLGDVVVPAFSTTLAVSDLVLGQATSGVHWNSGTTEVPLNPLNTYPNGGNAEVYFQLAGMQVGQHYVSRFEFFGANDDAKTPARLTLTFDQAAQRERAEVERTLGLRNLEPGKYRVTLTVSGPGGEATAAAWLTMLK